MSILRGRGNIIVDDQKARRQVGAAAQRVRVRLLRQMNAERGGVLARESKFTPIDLAESGRAAVQLIGSRRRD